MRTHGGWWALQVYYEWLPPFAGSNCGCRPDISKVAFDDKRKALEAWLERRPRSLTARVALGNLWRLRAWQLRGGAGAEKAQRDGVAGFPQVNGASRRTARRSRRDRRSDIYFIEMDTVIPSDLSRASLQSLYVHATAAFPTFPAYATQYYYYMLERSFGQPGQAALFAASLLTTPGGDQGAIEYVSVAATAASDSLGVDDLMKSGVDYNTLIGACAARQRTVGLTNRDWNVLLFYAVAARDKKGANFALKHVAGNWDRGIFTQALSKTG